MFPRPLSFDSTRVISSQRYQLVADQDRISGINITGIKAGEQGEAKLIADAELNGVLGLLALHNRDIPDKVEGNGIFELTSKGPERRMIATKLTLSVEQLPPAPIIDFAWLASNRDSAEGKALGMYYASCILRRASLLPETFLSFYLTLEIAVSNPTRMNKKYNDFFYIRNALVHTKLLNKTKKFIEKTFGTAKPSWRDPRTFRILSEYTLNIEKEVQTILLKRFTK